MRRYRSITVPAMHMSWKMAHSPCQSRISLISPILSLQACRTSPAVGEGKHVIQALIPGYMAELVSNLLAHAKGAIFVLNLGDLTALTQYQ